MNSFSKVEQLFTVLDKTTEKIKNDLDLTYLDALAESGENLVCNEISERLSPLVKQYVEQKYHSVQLDQLSREEIRKAFQLAVLKGMKEAIQPHHAMTPDSVGIFASYLAGKLVEERSELTVLDPAVGSGNLLTTVLNQLPMKKQQSYGVEIDDTLLRLASVICNLQKHYVEFYHQDSIRPLYVDPVDLVVSDLPVGYYPDDDVAKSFAVHSEKGHTFAHHLLIEQSINYLKESGFGVLLIPNSLFTSEQAPLLQAFLKENAVILGVVQLPLSLFKQESQAKSILLLQKNGPKTKKPKQALLVELPSFSKKDALRGVMKQMDEWFQNDWRNS
ncbi:class I SAM-dependent methyltransferase [Fictibacillus sp. Mic-4]|uniref:class I SAM-dependent methyltransferase n=1 Tax=Fictibacillus TaxID=1329200 RepID=UPI0004196FA6|nr:class I SAM-dependent methyltransferase [Fictibacillus gelatini]